MEELITMAKIKNLPIVLNVKEAAELLRVSENTIYRLIKKKELYAEKYGGVYKIPTGPLLCKLGIESITEERKVVG